MKSYLHRDRLRRFAISLASRFLLLVIISSFAGSFLPLATSAEESTMPCCVGKTEGHCDSGLNAHKAPQPEPEPMCGLTSPVVLNLDEVTVDAEPVHQTHKSSAASSSTSPAAESNTVEKQCQMDCGACATATSRHHRNTIVQMRVAQRTTATTTVRFEESSLLFSSNQDWTRISPRGPPSLS